MPIARRLEQNPAETVHNYTQYNARQIWCFVLPTLFTFLAIVAYSLRAFTRIKIVKRFGSEDWACLVALCASIVLTALICAETYYGNGVHIGQVDLSTAMIMFRLFYVSVWIYNIGLSMTKISILLQYQRLFAMSSVRIVCWIVLAVTVVFGIWSVLGNVFLCLPVQYWWDKSLDGHCMDETAVWLSNSVINMATDIIIVIIPLPVVYRLCISLKQKLVLTLLFVLGGFGCVTSGLRVRSVIRISTSKDVTWDNAPAAIWSSVEVNVAIICACLATLKPLLVRYAPRILSASISMTDTNRASRVGSTTMAVDPASPVSPGTIRTGGAVFGSFTFDIENPDQTPKKNLRLRAMSFSEQNPTSPVTPRKSFFGSFSLRRGSAPIASRERNNAYPQSPGELASGHQAFTKENENHIHGRLNTATPSTMVTESSNGKDGSFLHSDGTKSEEDLYHAMLRVQTRDSRRGGSLSGKSTGRRPSAVTFNLEPQYEEEAKRRPQQ